MSERKQNTEVSTFDKKIECFWLSMHGQIYSTFAFNVYKNVDFNLFVHTVLCDVDFNLFVHTVLCAVKRCACYYKKYIRKFKTLKNPRPYDFNLREMLQKPVCPCHYPCMGILKGGGLCRSKAKSARPYFFFLIKMVCCMTQNYV